MASPSGSGAAASYFTSAVAVAVAKVAIFASAFVALWAATAILSKAEFGAYAVALSMLWLAGVFAAQGLDKAALYHLSSAGVPLTGGRRVAGYFARAGAAGLGLSGVFFAAGSLAPPSADMPGLGYGAAGFALLAPRKPRAQSGASPRARLFRPPDKSSARQFSRRRR